MKCSYCGHLQDKVVDSRTSQDGLQIRRRRECLKCSRRFTTYEAIEAIPLMVIKRDGSRDPYERKKILAGILKACEKRPVSMEKLEEMVTSIERQIMRKFEREVTSTAIGELVMEKLAGLDEVAYVRFASVYRQFKDVNQFMKELKDILDRSAGK